MGWEWASYQENTESRLLSLEKVTSLGLGRGWAGIWSQACWSLGRVLPLHHRAGDQEFISGRWEYRAEKAHSWSRKDPTSWQMCWDSPQVTEAHGIQWEVAQENRVLQMLRGWITSSWGHWGMRPWGEGGGNERFGVFARRHITLVILHQQPYETGRAHFTDKVDRQEVTYLRSQLLGESCKWMALSVSKAHILSIITNLQCCRGALAAWGLRSRPGRWGSSPNPKLHLRGSALHMYL